MRILPPHFFYYFFELKIFSHQSINFSFHNFILFLPEFKYTLIKLVDSSEFVLCNFGVRDDNFLNFLLIFSGFFVIHFLV